MGEGDRFAPRTTLLLELWGMGDAVIATSALQPLCAAGRRVIVMGKPLTRELLEPSHPEVEFVEFGAPWTAFRGKYRLWSWPWREIGRLVSRLRRIGIDEALSVRRDPRDHLLMLLVGAGVRCGFAHPGFPGLLNAPVTPAEGVRHRVEDWHALVRRLLGHEAPARAPRIERGSSSGLADVRSAAGRTPIVVLHCGAGNAIRRWPLEHYRELLGGLRQRYSFHLVVIPDADGFGASLRSEADTFLPRPSLGKLCAVLSGATLFLGNDSGPGHLAAAVGTPTVSIFGPQHPELIRPYGDANLTLAGEPCAHLPCSDYCRFAEPLCLTRLRPGGVLDRVVAHVDRGIARGTLPASLRGGHTRTAPIRSAPPRGPRPRRGACGAVPAAEARSTR